MIALADPRSGAELIARRRRGHAGEGGHEDGWSDSFRFLAGPEVKLVGTGLPSSNFGLRGKNLGHVIYRDFGPNTGLPNMPLRIFVIYGRLHPLRTYLCYTTTQNSCLQCSQNLNKEYMNEFLASCSTVLCNRNLYKMQQKKKVKTARARIADAHMNIFTLAKKNMKYSSTLRGNLHWL